MYIIYIENILEGSEYSHFSWWCKNLGITDSDYKPHLYKINKKTVE